MTKKRTQDVAAQYPYGGFEVMTTPNIEELIDRLYDWHNTSAEQNRLDMQKAADLLQSQAERIKELEVDFVRLEATAQKFCVRNAFVEAERDNLRHELKTAQEGWRCECSTDDACRFARERDALRAELGDLPEAQAEMLAEIKQLRAQLAEIEKQEPIATINDLSNSRMFTLEANGYSRKDKLFTRPMPAQDVAELVEALKACLQCFDEMKGRKPSFVEDSIAMSKEALSKYKGAK